MSKIKNPTKVALGRFFVSTMSCVKKVNLPQQEILSQYGCGINQKVVNRHFPEMNSSGKCLFTTFPSKTNRKTAIYFAAEENVCLILCKFPIFDGRKMESCFFSFVWSSCDHIYPHIDIFIDKKK